MDFNFTPEHAKTVITVVSPFLITLAGYVLARPTLPTWQKGAISFGIAVLLAAFQTYAAGELVSNFWSNLFIIFGAAEFLYITIFKGIGLEKILFPVEAVVNTAAQVTKDQLSTLTKDEAQSVLSNTSTATVEVKAELVT